MNDAKQQLLYMVLDVVERLEGKLPEDPDEYESNNELDMFMEDVLSIETIKKSTNGDWKGVELLWTFGGPGITIDTEWNQVEGYWGSDHFSRSYEDKIGLDDYMKEIYNEN